VKRSHWFWLASTLLLVLAFVLLGAGCKQQSGSSAVTKPAGPEGPAGKAASKPADIPNAKGATLPSELTNDDQAVLDYVKSLDPLKEDLTDEDFAKLTHLFHTASNFTVRSSILRKLGLVYDKRAEQLLLEGLKDPNEEVRLAAFDALGAYDDAAARKARLDALKRASSSHEMSEIIKGLGSQLDDPKVLEIALDILKSNSMGELKAQAIGLLSRGHYKPALPVIKQYLTSTNMQLRDAALQAVMTLEVPNEEGPARYKTLLELAKANLPLLSTQAQLLLVEEKDFSRPIIEQALATSKDPDTRLKAAEILALISDPSSLPILTQALKDPDPLVQEQAANGLAQLKLDKAAVQALSQLLVNSPMDYVRVACAHALALAADPDSIDALTKGLDDSDVWVRRYSVQGLAACARKAPEKVKPALLKAIHDDNEHVRAYAADGLGKLGQEAIAEQLIELLQDPDWRARVAACRALGELKYRPAKHALVEVLKTDVPEVQHAARRALQRLIY